MLWCWANPTCHGSSRDSRQRAICWLTLLSGWLSRASASVQALLQLIISVISACTTAQGLWPSTLVAASVCPTFATKQRGATGLASQDELLGDPCS